MSEEILLSVLFCLLFFVSETPASTAVAKDEHHVKSPSIHLLDEPTGRKTRKESDRILARGAKLNYLKRLSEKFYKNKSPKKLGYLLSKSWGAGGMPFNVLYTPNSHQQKILKSLRENSSFEGKARISPDRVFSFDGKSRQKLFKKQSMSRKYYSFIPQLFVSYGW